MTNVWKNLSEIKEIKIDFDKHQDTTDTNSYIEKGIQSIYLQGCCDLTQIIWTDLNQKEKNIRPGTDGKSECFRLDCVWGSQGVWRVACDACLLQQRLEGHVKLG